jgi:hypothetical protein
MTEDANDTCANCANGIKRYSSFVDCKIRKAYYLKSHSCGLWQERREKKDDVQQDGIQGENQDSDLELSGSARRQD